MKKVVSLFLVFFFLGFAMLWCAPVVLKVKVQMANVRQEPDTSSMIISQVNRGTELVALSRAGEWYEISVLDKSGKTVSAYIHSNTVAVVGEDSGDSDEDAEVKEIKPVKRSKTVSSTRNSSSRQVTSHKAGGVKLIGGLAFNSFKFEDPLPPEIKQQSDLGFMGGVGFEFGSGRVGFELDFLAGTGGSSFVPQEGMGEDNNKMTISGFGLYAPVLIKVRLMNNGGPFLLAGGTVGYMFSQKITVTDGEDKYEEDVSDAINKLYYGISFGGGYELPMESMSLLFEFRYNMGLSNWVKSDAETQAGDKLKSNIITLLLGIKF